MGVFVIGCLEHLRRFLIAEDCSGCERLWGMSGLDKALRHFGFDTVARRHPLIVLPGATGCSSPSSFTIPSPTGAPVSRMTSAKSPSVLMHK